MLNLKKNYYKTVSSCYLFLRNVKHRQFRQKINDFYVQDSDYSFPEAELPKNINGIEYTNRNRIVYYYGENTAVSTFENMEWRDTIPTVSGDIHDLWWNIILNSKVPFGFVNTGLYQTAFVLEKKIPVLSSWIWTSAAIARLYYEVGNVTECVGIADSFLSLQKNDGGWLVRNDQDKYQIVPAYAPNDSAYIARHSLLNAYKLTKKDQYLQGAEQCAQWIMKNTNKLNLVPTNLYDLNQNIIVDIGFTLSLFSELYRITNKQDYLVYLKKFQDSYIKYFYNEKTKLFSTSIDNKGLQYGGYFSRGQAWALEGLIDVYKITKDPYLHKVIDSTVNTLIKKQYSDGSWSYNFSRPYLGVDNKGIAIIGNVIVDWYLNGSQKQAYMNSAVNALKWCKNHTRTEAPFIGGIFDFCFEGAINKYFNSQTAFLYTNSYALILEKNTELNLFVKKNKKQKTENRKLYL